MPGSILILGGGAAGNMAAETLRREGYAGGIGTLSADSSMPYDRPNLSKDYLAGNAPEEWIALRSPEFYLMRSTELSCISAPAPWQSTWRGGRCRSKTAAATPTTRC